MDDVFYFTKLILKLEDIAVQAVNCRYSYEYIDGVNRYLRIYNDNLNDYWDWGLIEKDDGVVFEDNPLQKIAAFEPATSFMITYHTYSLSLLAQFIKRVLQVYPGWVGCDDDFEVTYTVENIETIKCHWDS